MPPSDYIRTRKLSQEPSNSKNESYFKVVDYQPYFPNLSVSASDISSVKHAALALVYSSLLLRNNGDNGAAAQIDNNNDEAENQKKLINFLFLD